MSPKKYVFVNGVMKLNPEYEKPAGFSASDKGQRQHQLAVISSPQDVEAMKQVFDEVDNPDDNHEEMVCHSNVSAAKAIMEEEEYVESYSNTGGSLFAQLIEYFIMYEVPIGLLYKLLELRKYRLHFLIDDSGSMNSKSDVSWDEATPYLPRNGQNGTMTRILEEENRLHIFIDILAYIPTKGIRILFMNTNLEITLLQAGRSPEEFKADAHNTIRNAFSNLSFGLTPTFRLLTKSFDEAKASGCPTAHYLLTDGVPSDKSADEVGRLIQNRESPATNPVTLISCTNVDSECEWMKNIEEIAPYTSECDDYGDEKAEVLKDQGPALPYTRGFWLICGLVAAMNPHDLDAMDESIPFTRHTLDELLGRTHTAEEYHYYFHSNPHGRHYEDRYEQFLVEKCAAVQIVPKDQQHRPVHTTSRSAQSNDECCIVM